MLCLVQPESEPELREVEEILIKSEAPAPFSEDENFDSNSEI